MDEPVWTMIDNTSEVTHTLSATFDSTNALKTLSLPQARKSVAPTVVTLIVLSTGSFANAVVLAIMVRARKHAGTSVHTLIANQSAMDLFACVTGVINSVVMFTNHFKYEGNPVVDGIICIIFEGVALQIQVQFHHF